MANPNNAVGTNGAFGGRTSVNAFNDVLATFTGRGVIQGWAVTPSTGLKVNVGGQSGIRDVAIAEDNNGNRTTIDNISQAPIEITMPSAPSTGSRIDLIVGYVENPPQGSSTVIDNPAPTGIITVSGSSSSSPSAPTDSAIRTALTNAGINGATAYYAVLGSITIPSGTTDISSNMINATPYTNLNTQNNIATGQITADKIDFATTVGTVSTVHAGTNNSFVRVNPSGVGVLGIVYRPNTNIPAARDTTILKSDILPDVQYALNTALQGVASGNQMGILNFKTNGDIDFYNNSSGGYGSWIRAIIPFVADV